jgi:hypothetical protein
MTAAALLIVTIALLLQIAEGAQLRRRCSALRAERVESGRRLVDAYWEQERLANRCTALANQLTTVYHQRAAADARTESKGDPKT